MTDCSWLCPLRGCSMQYAGLTVPPTGPGSTSTLFAPPHHTSAGQLYNADPDFSQASDRSDLNDWDNDALYNTGQVWPLTVTVSAATPCGSGIDPIKFGTAKHQLHTGARRRRLLQQDAHGNYTALSEELLTWDWDLYIAAFAAGLQVNASRLSVDNHALDTDLLLEVTFGVWDDPGLGDDWSGADVNFNLSASDLLALLNDTAVVGAISAQLPYIPNTLLAVTLSCPTCGDDYFCDATQAYTCQPLPVAAMQPGSSTGAYSSSSTGSVPVIEEDGDEDSGSGAGLSHGAVAGIVIAGLVGLALLTLVTGCCVLAARRGCEMPRVSKLGHTAKSAAPSGADPTGQTLTPVVSGVGFHSPTGMSTHSTGWPAAVEMGTITSTTA